MRRADDDEQVSAASLITTMMLFARALSRTPRRSNHVMTITIANAGRLTRMGTPNSRGAVSRQPVYFGNRTEERRAIPGRQPDRRLHADAPDERVEVVAPRDRDSDVADGVLEDQVPADDPGHEFAQRRVRIGVSAPACGIIAASSA